MVEKSGARDVASYVLGILSVVFAFFQPIPGLVLGIVGFIQAKGEKSKLAVIARKLNTWGMILSAIMIIAVIIFSVYAVKSNFGLA